MSRPKTPAAQPQTLMSRILRTPEILARYGISLPTLSVPLDQGKEVPQAVQAAPDSRSTDWYEGEIAEFEAKRKAA
jgi:predicted DNA-binding transcriptional regulator AlpA